MKDEIIRMLNAGYSNKEISETVGCARSTVTWYTQQLGLTSPRKFVDWEAIAEYYETHTRVDCIKHFDISDTAWVLAVNRGDIISRGNADFRYTNEQILVENSTYDTTDLKRRLLKEEILANVCKLCGQLPEHNGLPLVLQLDHINGTHNDHRIENLRILCPNCHTQTDTWGRKRNKKKK